MVQKNLLLLHAHHPKPDLQSLHHDRVSDLKKKKMKKSGSIKHAKPPGEPPPRKQPPNYMKPTTSSDARKEQSLAITAKTPDVSALHRRKLALVSANRGPKTSNSSMKMRNLTRNPNFKPARGSSVMKCSAAAVVLCEDKDVKRATCSSTLKHCQFPSYLSLDHGGTESEGSSSIKVCPYTYCSLNGHHRESFPPLKVFLSARRRAVKTQMSVNLGCVSPRRVEGLNEMEDDLEGSMVASAIEEEQRGFFIEIYSERNEDGAADYSRDTDESVDLLQEDQEERALEAPICYEDGVGENLDGDGKMSLVEVEADGEISPPSILAQEGRSDLGFLSELPVQSMPIVDDSCESDCEASDYEGEYSYGTKVEPDPDLGEVDSEGFMIKSDNKGGCFDEFLVYEVLQESYDEQSLNSDAFYGSDCDGESTSSYDYLPSSNHTLFEEDITSFGSLKHNPKEDSVAAMEDQDEAITSADDGCKIQTELSDEDHHQISHNKNSTTLISPIDPAKEPQNARPAFKKQSAGDNEMGLFDPRGPNFLPVEPGPDGEKVDLRHQDLDERKNAEEWMVDYALRQVVTKLGPARKKKVALLVEAFEKVMPETKWGFDQARPIQACS